MCCYNEENPDCECDWECDMCGYGYYDEDYPEDDDDEDSQEAGADCPT